MAMQPLPFLSSKLVAVMGCRGGAGTSFLTVQLASILAMQHRRKVLVVDLSHPFGDAALMLSSLPPPVTLDVLASHPERLDESLLQNALSFPRPGLGVLAASDQAIEAPVMDSGFVRHLLSLAARQFDAILLDCGRCSSPFLNEIVPLARFVVPVLRPTLPMMRDARKLLQLVAQWNVQASQLLPVVNGVPPDSRISPADVAAALGLRGIHAIAEDSALTEAMMDDGDTLLERHPRHTVTRQLVALANRLDCAHDATHGLPSSLPQETLLSRFWKSIATTLANLLSHPDRNSAP
jgi:pilus assembly protein CpaE